MPRLVNSAKHTLLVLFILMVPFSLFCQDAWSETISGTLFYQDGSTPFDQQVEITVYQGNPCQHYDHITSASVDPATGIFTITGVPPGQYYLKIRNNSQTNALEKWWNDTNGSLDCSQAQAITVIEGQPLSLTGLPFKTQTGGIITGTVYESGTTTPIEGLYIFAESSACGGTRYGGAGTDASGNYTITGIPSGTVYVSVCPKCDNQNYVDEFYDGSFGTIDCNQAAGVQVVENQVTPEIDFTLDAGGTITGQVTDMDGNGLANVEINSYQDLCYKNYFRWTQTDVDGNYTIMGIPDNTDLYLYADSKTNTSPIPYKDEWYDNIAENDCVSATAVHVNAGQTIPVIDFQLNYDIPFELQYVHNPDGSFKLQYYLEFYPLDNFTPDSVVSIHLTDPSGNVIKTYTRQEGVQGYGDFEYVDQWKMFEAKSLNITPELGEYTFTIVTDTFTAIVKRGKTLNRVIPVPDASQIQPVDNAVLTSKTPIFSWAPVHLEGVPLFYRIQIFDQTGYRVFSSKREQNLLSIAIPNNAITPGESYNWMVNVYDSDNWEILENRANSVTFNFTMADSPAHANIPALGMSNWGAVSYRTSDWSSTENWIRVIDHDGVAYDGSSHNVAVTYNGETHPLSFMRVDSPTSGSYEWFDYEVSAVPGDYVFTVTDPDGNTGTLTDTLVVNIMPSPDENAFAVTANGTTPTFTWDPVPNAIRYRVRIYNLDGSTAWNGYPETLPAPSYTVPPGVLQPNTPYNYRIEAWDGHSGLDVDNVSKSPASNSNNPKFQTRIETTAPFVEIATNAETWNSSLTGPYLTFWIKIHDAQGVPENIKSVKATFPDGTEIPLYLNYTESSTCGIYINDDFALPIAPGNYTITVEDLDGHINTHTDLLDVSPIGYPSEESITAVFNETQGDFTWNPVPGAAFYRLEIYDMDFNRLYAFATTTNAYHIPAGFLKQNTFYRYRITTRKEFFDQGVDNGSTSNNRNRMKTIFTTPDPGSAMPSIDLNEFGAFVIHSQKAGTSDSTFWLEFEVMVRDPDGVPDNISTVRVVYPDGTTTRDLRLDSSVEPGVTQGVYSYYETYDTSQDIQPGIYIFTVTDVAGNTATVTDSLDIDPLPIPANYTPAHGSSVGSTTPVISWDPVPAATRYRLRIYKNWDDKIHDIHNLTTNSYTIPANVLGMNDIYNYRISAYKDIEGGDVDNMSINQIFPSERPHFTISPATTGDINGDGSIDLSDALLVMKIMTGGSPDKTICLSADVNQDGKIGMADILYILQQIPRQ